MVRKIYFLLMLITPFIIANGQVSVVTQHNDLARTGWNNSETVLNPGNVNVKQFGKIFKVQVDDQLYAQPLILSNLTIANGKHNVVFLATTNNSVYAADADNGTVYWNKNFTPAGQRPPRNTDMTGACGGNYKDVFGNMGILGTPVIDSVSKTIYLVTRHTTGTTGTYTQYFHALDATTGNERANSPLEIKATSNGTGSGNVNGVISFDPQKNNQRQALTLHNGIVYVTFSSHCDWQPYHGWVLGYDAKTLELKTVYNATTNGYEAGLWQSGGGPSIDEAGFMYLVTGNGSVGTNKDINDLSNRGESAIKLKPTNGTMAVTSFFTPKNFINLEMADLDYGSMAAFLIPGAKRYVTGCKDGNLYVLNTDNLGGFNSSYNNVSQTIILGNNATMRCQPSYYKSSTKEFVYVWSENSQLKAYPFDRTSSTLDVDNVVSASPQGPVGASGAVISTSSNNSKDGSGIVWTSYSANGDANQSLRPGILRAFDANDVTRELWNSNENANRDGVGYYAKFSSPTIANGKVYLATFSNQLNVYGIIDTTPQKPVCNANTNVALGKPAYSSSNESTTLLPGLAFDGNNTTRWASANNTTPEWLYVDLGEIDSICNVTVNWHTSYAKDFQVQVSNDAATWKSIATVTNNNTQNNSFDVFALGRYVRLYCTAKAAAGGYSVLEMKVFGNPIQGCVTPNGVTVNHITATGATIRWNYTNSPSYFVQLKPKSSSKWQTFTTKSDSLVVTGLTCGNYYSYRVQSTCAKTNVSSYSEEASFNTLTCTDCGLLPTRFYTADIGDIAIGGQACYDAPKALFTVKGSGVDIGNNGDAFRFAYKTISGSTRLVVKVTNQDDADVLNKAGIMFRESLDATSRFAFVGITSGSGVTFQYRYVTKASSTNAFTTGFKAPCYLALAKENTTYTAYVSKDSINWTQLGSIKIPNFGGGDYPIYAGLAVSSHNNSKTSTAIFNEFSLVPKDTIIMPPVDTTCSPLMYGINTLDIGNVSQAGSVCFIKSKDSYTVTGSGDDAIKFADNFRYVYRPFAGDGYIDTRIASQDKANAGNEAGLMFRESLTADSRNFFVGVTSGMGAFYQYRADNGASTSVKYVTGIKAPYYVRIVKKGDTYSAYISPDSTTWSLLIRPINLPGMGLNGKNVYVGFAVNSHSSTKQTTAVFDRSHIIINKTNARIAATDTTKAINNAPLDVAAPTALKVYPNPTSNIINVDFSVADKQDITLRIVGIADGRTYYNESLSNFSGHYRKKFSNLQLPSGTYAVSVKSKAGFKTEIFIKE